MSGHANVSRLHRGAHTVARVCHPLAGRLKRQVDFEMLARRHVGRAGPAVATQGHVKGKSRLAVTRRRWGSEISVSFCQRIPQSLGSETKT